MPPRITDAQKKKLWEFFDKEGWTRAKQFPKQNGDKALDDLLQKIGITDRKKASHQLLKWKRAKYEHASTVFTFTEDEARIFVKSHMIGQDYLEYIKLVINRMLGKVDVENSHLSNVRHYAAVNKTVGPELLEFVLTQQPLLQELVVLLTFYEELLVLYLPKQRIDKTRAKLRFENAKQNACRRDGKLSRRFMDALSKVNTSSVMASFSDERKDEEWVRLYLALAVSLDLCWRISNFENQRLPITVSHAETPTIHNSSQSVVAYIGGWVISCLKAKRGLQKKCMHNTHSLVEAFIGINAVTEAKAKDDGIPMGYIHMRMKQAEKLHFPSLSFYRFLCRVESTYIENYNLKMLLSHSDGNLLKEIKRALLSDTIIMKEFSQLFKDPVSISDLKSPAHQVFVYVLTKYRNMRIKYIGKSHQALRKKGGDKLEKASLRTRVAVADIKTGQSNAPTNEIDVLLKVATDGAADSDDSDGDGDSSVGSREDDDAADREAVDSLDFQEFLNDDSEDDSDVDDKEESLDEQMEQAHSKKRKVGLADDPY